MEMRPQIVIALVLTAFAAGIVLGSRAKKTRFVTEKGDTIEKVVYKDRVVNKTVYSTITTTVGKKHVVEQKKEVYNSESKTNTASKEVVVENPVPVDAKVQWGVGMAYDVHGKEFKEEYFKPVLLAPVSDHVQLMLSTDLKLQSFEGGLVFEF